MAFARKFASGKERHVPSYLTLSWLTDGHKNAGHGLPNHSFQCFICIRRCHVLLAVLCWYAHLWNWVALGQDKRDKTRKGKIWHENQLMFGSGRWNQGICFEVVVWPGDYRNSSQEGGQHCRISRPFFLGLGETENVFGILLNFVLCFRSESFELRGVQCTDIRSVAETTYQDQNHWTGNTAGWQSEIYLMRTSDGDMTESGSHQPWYPVVLFKSSLGSVSMGRNAILR